MHPLLVDRHPPTTSTAREKLTAQATKLLVAVGRWRAVASALAATGYGEKDQREGLRLLQAALPFGEEPRDEDVAALHAWVLEQHERALGAEMKLSHLIALGVAERWVRPIPEQSAIVLKRVRR